MHFAEGKKIQQTKDKKNYPLSPCSRDMVCFMEAEWGWEVVLMTLITKHMPGSLFVMEYSTEKTVITPYILLL